MRPHMWWWEEYSMDFGGGWFCYGMNSDVISLWLIMTDNDTQILLLHSNKLTFLHSTYLIENLR